MSTETPTAAQIMNQSVVALRPDTPVADATRMLLKRGYSGAPVVDADGALVGVYSEKDCLTVLADAAWHNRVEGTVGDQMSRELVTLTPDRDLFSIVTLFQQSSIRRLPVVDGDRLVGLITRRDVLRALQEVEEQRYTPSSSPRYTLWEMPAR